MSRLLIGGWTALTLAALPSQAWSAVYYVDASNPSGSDSGPGTESQPYRTISAAVTQRGGAGTKILVKPGVYREQVTVGASGASGSPFVIQALGAGVVVDGTDDFSSSSLWVRTSGNVWRASSVSWTPLQVFADGARLTTSTGSPSSLPPGSFTYSSGSGLYVNVGGDNPGTHGTQVGHQTYGFRVSGRSWVTITGFTVRRTDNKGIYLSSASNVLIDGNVVCENADHGIYLTGVSSSTVRMNESFNNARPLVRAANGIQLYGSSGNRIEGNRFHDNQDTGLQINSGSNNNVCVQNRCWRNGDHGLDHLGSTGNVHLGDVAWGNYKDGFSIEGNASGTRLYNCVAIDNGLETNEFDLWVDSASANGFVSDYNLFWNSTGQPPVKYISTTYSTVSAYAAASGRDGHSLQADPRFVNATAGDFHPRAGSPLIDAANSSVSGWPATDAEGRARFDDPATPNKGVGPVTYADLGALEFNGTSPGQPPVAALTVTPSSGTAPLQVTANASGSGDPDGSIVSYRFDFGDGVVVGPQVGATATHTYTGGNWTATVTVTDNSGLTGSASRTVSVAMGQPPVAALTVTPSSGLEPLSVTANASGSSDPDGSVVSYRFDFGDGTVIGPQPGATATHSYSAGNWTATVTVTDNAGNTGSASRAVNVTADQPPVVTAPGTIRVTAGLPMVVNVTASDPDGQPITSLTADLSQLPSGNNAVFTVGPDKLSGQLRWTPVLGTKGNYRVSFTARNVLTGTATTTIQVRRLGLIAGERSEEEGAVEVLALAQAAPNPSRGEVAFALDLPRPTSVAWSIHDLQGRTLWSESGEYPAGHTVLRWGGGTRGRGPLGAGVYLLRMQADGERWVRRFVRL